MSAALWIASESIAPDPESKNARSLMVVTNEFPTRAVMTALTDGWEDSLDGAQKCPIRGRNAGRVIVGR